MLLSEIIVYFSIFLYPGEYKAVQKMNEFSFMHVSYKQVFI